MIRRLLFLAITLLLFSACGVVKVKKPPEPPQRGPLKGSRFEAGNAGDTPARWEMSSFFSGERARSDATPKHKIELTKSQKHGGKMSAVIGPVGKETLPQNLIGSARLCGDSPFPGSAFKVSAFIKGDPEGTVRVTMAWHGTPDYTTIRRPKSWTKFELLSLAPIPDPGPTDTRVTYRLCIFVAVQGSNRAWIDDLTFEKLEFALPPDKVHPIAIDNLDMERFDRGGTLANWTHIKVRSESDASGGYELKADRRVKRSGGASLLFTTDDPSGEMEPADSAAYCIDPTALKGKALRVAGWLKADTAEDGGAGLGILAGEFAIPDVLALSAEELHEFKPPGEMSSSSILVYQADDWVRYEVVLLVPKGTVSLCITVGLRQVGSVWADDLSMEVIDL